MILEKRKLHAVTFVRHLNDHRHRGGELSDRRGNSLIVRSTPVGYGRHPHLDVEIARELLKSLHVLHGCSFEVKALHNQAGGIKVGVLFQEVDRVAQLGNRERLAGISVNDAVALHLETCGSKVLELGGMSEVHENLVVKLPHVVDRLVERDVDGLAAPHCLIESDSDQKGGFADAVAGNDDSDLPTSKAPVNRVLEQSQRVAFVEFLAVHIDSSSIARLFLVGGHQAGAVLLDQFLMNLRRNRRVA